MKLGNTTNYKGVPVIEVHVGERTGYLSPFRGYRFQVSGTESGDGDYGSTSVTTLRGLDENVLYDLAELAIVKYQAYLKNTLKEDVYIQKFLDLDDQYKLVDFIKECQEWLWTLKV